MHRAHIRKWMWLHKFPGKNKNDWPEFVKNGGKIPHVTHHCFACGMAGPRDTRAGVDCSSCPFKWPLSKKHESILSAMCEYSIYGKWIVGTPKTRKKFAKQIAELPWKGPKMKTFTIRVAWR